MAATVDTAAQAVPTHLRAKNVSLKCGEELVYLQFIHMNSSIFVWVSVDASFNAFAMAMPSRFDSIPLATDLIGDTSDPTSRAIAQRIAKRTGMQCFVSCNIPAASHALLPFIEKRIAEEIASTPSIASLTAS